MKNKEGELKNFRENLYGCFSETISFTVNLQSFI